MEADDTETEPLSDVRVLDFSTVMAGPYCTRVLAGLGADVVKVESPDGDYTRGAEPLRAGRSAYFAELNNGKRGIMLDLRDADDLQVAHELAARADVVVQNFRPGVLARYGLDYDSLVRSHPELVYCSITGYGQQGPRSGHPATAQAVQATVGYDLAFAAYQQGDAMPPATGLFPADGMAGALAVSGVLAALRIRDSTGLGRHVDVSLDRSLLSMLVYEVQSAQFDPGFVRKGYRPARTCDGYVMIAAVNKRNFEALSRTISRPDLLTDPRFATTAPRWRSYDDLHRIIEQWTSSRTAAECEEALLAAGVPVAQYRTVGEYLADPFTRDRVLLDATDGAGSLQVTRLPFTIESRDEHRPDGTPPPDPAKPPHVPELGGDRADVLHDWLGVEPAERGYEPATHLQST